MCKYVVSAWLRSTLYKGGMEKERGRKCSNFSQKGKGGGGGGGGEDFPHNNEGFVK